MDAFHEAADGSHAQMKRLKSTANLMPSAPTATRSAPKEPVATLSTGGEPLATPTQSAPFAPEEPFATPLGSTRLMDQLTSQLEAQPSTGAAFEAMGLGFLHFDPRELEDSQDQHECHGPSFNEKGEVIDSYDGPPVNEKGEVIVGHGSPVNEKKDDLIEIPDEPTAPKMACPPGASTHKKNEDKKGAPNKETSRAWHQKYVSKGVLRNPPSGAKGPSTHSSLQKAREAFITQWINESGMAKSQERFKAACQAWMESSIRADFIAGRTGTQK